METLELWPSLTAPCACARSHRKPSSECNSVSRARTRWVREPRVAFSNPAKLATFPVVLSAWLGEHIDVVEAAQVDRDHRPRGAHATRERLDATGLAE